VRDTVFSFFPSHSANKGIWFHNEITTQTLCCSDPLITMENVTLGKQKTTVTPCIIASTMHL
jgi:hypothetical protein